ncbi:centrosomal protein POC5-like isoform X2 [Convolutriloba macropyga]|uniref:centrosomal protein POC5-like isoform X2 n=1 Tax=Convolutriloba macropyga TaxID=536237 RepID=UPI003F51B9AA
MSSEDEEQGPCIGLNDSRGSSVSSTMKNDYDELMRFVNIVPKKILSPDRQSEQRTTKKCKATALNGSENVDFKENCSVENWLNDAERIDRTDKQSDNIHLAGDAVLMQDRIGICDSRNTEVINGKAKRADSFSSNGRRTAQSHQHLRTANETSVTCLELSLDKWCLDLKSMVMDNFSTWRMSVLEQQKAEHEQAKHRFRVENDKYLDEIDNLKEQLLSMRTELSEKEKTIEGLQTVVNKQSELISKSKLMFKWKNEMENAQREQLCLKMADVYRNRKLLARAWANWHCLIENKWKERVEKACQLRAQEVCHKLEEKYQHQLEEMEKGLNDSRLQIESMQEEKLQYEENMRQAFLRGLSALNQEAHTIFHTPRSQQTSVSSSSALVQNVNSASYLQKQTDLYSGPSGCNSQRMGADDSDNVQPTAQLQMPRSVNQTPFLGWQKSRSSLNLDSFRPVSSFGMSEAVGSLIDVTPALTVDPTTASGIHRQQQSNQQYFNNQTHQVYPNSNQAGISPPTSAPVVVSARTAVSFNQQQLSSTYQPAIPGPSALSGITPRNIDTSLNNNSNVGNAKVAITSSAALATSASTSNLSSAVGGSIGRKVKRTAIVERHSTNPNVTAPTNNVAKSTVAPSLPAVKVKQSFR